MMRFLAVVGTLLAGLLFCAQTPLPGFPPGLFTNRAALSGGGSFTPSCTESSNFLARATNVTLTADKTNYDTLICGMVTDGTWAKMDAVYIFAAPDSTTGKLSLVSATFNGATTLSFTAYQGFTGDGTNPFTTGFIPSTAGGQFALNGASYGAYNLTSNTTENVQPMGAAHGNTSTMTIQPNFSNAACQVNAGSNAAVTATNSQGFWQCSRTSSSSVGISKNGAAATTAASTPTGLVDVQFYILCQNSNGSAAGCTTNQYSAAFIGGALTNTDIANISSRINFYMFNLAVPINVY